LVEDTVSSLEDYFAALRDPEKRENYKHYKTKKPTSEYLVEDTVSSLEDYFAALRDPEKRENYKH